MIRTAIRKLLSNCSPRNSPRSRARLRPALMALEDRQLLANYIVTNPTDTPVAGETDLRQAIAEANSERGFNTITFSSFFNTPQTITLTSGALDVKHDVLTIECPAAGLTVSGDSKSRVLVVEGHAWAHISNLTITGGYESNDYGGGVYNRGGLVLDNCTVTKNRSETRLVNDYGGGVYNIGGKLTMTNCTVSNNEAGPGNSFFPYSRYGGGIANYNGTVDLVNCTINDNDAEGAHGKGGGLYNYGRANLTNCTFVGNDAAHGGGLQNHGDAEVVSCTFTGNQAHAGGGLYLYRALSIWNTIIGGNTASWAQDVEGRVHSGGNGSPRGGHNLISSTIGSHGWVSIQNGGTDLTNVDPGVSRLGSYGGPTQTVALLPSSPAIHRGRRVNYAGTNKPLLTDQRGLPLDEPPDIGAFQAQNVDINS
jgi:hypothetical protein